MVRNTHALSIMDYVKKKAVNKGLQDLRGGRASAWKSLRPTQHATRLHINGKELSLNKSATEM